jgi:L-lactate utilization protein LutC
MLSELKSYVKELYVLRKIDADRYRQLLKVSNDLKDAKDRTEAYDMLIELATDKGYSEFKKFLTRNRLRAAEEMEGTFMKKVDELIDQKEVEKAMLLLQMMRGMY